MPDRACVWAVFAALVLAPGAAFAASDSANPAAPALSAAAATSSAPVTDLPPVSVQPVPVVVSVSRASDLVGKPRYAARSTVSSSAAEIDFSDHPVVERVAIQTTGGLLPVRSSRVSSVFGMRRNPISGDVRLHGGVDLAAPTGSPVYSTQSGVVRRAQWAGGYGLLVEISDGHGFATRYGHLSRISVSAGQAVQAGALLGYVGSTGNSTGPHLHYETRVNGRPTNPLSK